MVLLRPDPRTTSLPTIDLGLLILPHEGREGDRVVVESLGDRLVQRRDWYLHRLVRIHAMNRWFAFLIFGVGNIWQQVFGPGSIDIE